MANLLMLGFAIRKRLSLVMSEQDTKHQYKTKSHGLHRFDRLAFQLLNTNAQQAYPETNRNG